MSGDFPGGPRPFGDSAEWPGSVPAQAPICPGFTAFNPIGFGGTSVVWDAVGAEGSLPAALKVAYTNDALTSERFLRDAELMRRVGPPHAPAVYASGHLDDGRPYIAMERLFGSTLAARLAALSEPPSLAFVTAAADAVLSALAGAHERGVVHRDLKPENVVLAEAPGLDPAMDEGERGPAESSGREVRAPRSMRAVMIDFGLASSGPLGGDADPSRPALVVGTTGYMAPEQIRGERAIDERADIYAFGVILYQLLTLERPFERDGAAVSQAHLTQRPRRPSELAAVPDEIDTIVLECLAKEPQGRPASAAALRRDLARACAVALQGGPSRAPAPAPAPPTRRSSGTRLAIAPDEGRRPTVVLLAETSGGAVLVSSIVKKRGGFVARQHGRRFACVFLGTEAGDPARAAIAAAHEITARHGAKAALHLADLKLRPREGGPPAAYGQAVEHPETWLPGDAWGGVLLTADFARAVPEAELDLAAEGAAFRTLSQAPASVTIAPPSSSEGSPASAIVSAAGASLAPLFGQERARSVLSESAGASFEAACPGLVTIFGEPGLGKSRLAAEAAAIARRLSPGATVLTLRASPPMVGETAPTARALLEQILCLGGGSPAREGADRAPAIGAANRRSVMRAISEGLLDLSRRGLVAVVLDDAHWADDVALDALEHATLGAEGCALWVVIAAQPRLEKARRMWGARAQRHDRVELEPLEEAAAMLFAAKLLEPAEYPPATMLRRLTQWAGRSPACIADLTRALKRAGALRRRGETGSYYLATAVLERLPPQPAQQWLAVRTLDALPPELAECVRLCSVLGVRFSGEEAALVDDALDRAFEAGARVDVGVGLRALVAWEILEPNEGGEYSFRSAVFQEAVYKLLDPARAEQTHRRAFEVWRAQTASRAGGGAGASPVEDALARLARHAGACGARAEAAEALLALAELSSAGNRHVEADHHSSMALAYLDEGDARRRAVALVRRGRARYRLYRTAEALDDLAAARALASTLGEDALLADILLEEATALDLRSEFVASARRVDEAAALVERLGDADLTLRFWVALGRSRWRQERVPEAIELLERGAAPSVAYDTRVVALLLLACALAVGGRADDALARYDEVIALCEEADDLLHLGMAYLNRMLLWVVKRSFDPCVRDLRRATELAREVGNPWIERAATINTAEFLHWKGEDDEALALARRARVLAERFVETPVYEEDLLLARIHLRRGERDEARWSLEWIGRSCAPSEAPPTARAFFRAIELVLEEVHGRKPQAGSWASDGGWSDVLEQAKDSLFTEELCEILYWRVVTAVVSGRYDEARETIAQNRARLASSPAFWAQLSDIEARLEALPDEP